MVKSIAGLDSVIWQFFVTLNQKYSIKKQAINPSSVAKKMICIFINVNNFRLPRLLGDVRISWNLFTDCNQIHLRIN